LSKFIFKLIYLALNFECNGHLLCFHLNSLKCVDEEGTYQNSVAVSTNLMLVLSVCICVYRVFRKKHDSFSICVSNFENCLNFIMRKAFCVFVTSVFGRIFFTECLFCQECIVSVKCVIGV